MKIFTSIIFLFLLLLVPTGVFAQVNIDLIVCNGPNCDFNSVITLAIRIINFLTVLSASLAAISFCYAGFLLITSGGDPGARKKAQEIFTKTAIGFAFVLGAWVIVYTLVNTLTTGGGFNLLS
jgi:hypothetical protein